MCVCVCERKRDRERERCVCIYLHIIYIQFTRKSSLPFVLLDYVGGWLILRK